MDIVQHASPVNPFDSTRRNRADGSEFWSARELMPLLGYSTWAKFLDSLLRAMAACTASQQNEKDHFAASSKLVTIGSGAKRRVYDAELTRYAAYLVAMNSDARKLEVALAQTYFAQQARRAEIAQATPGLDFSALNQIIGMTAQAITAQAETTKAEIRQEMDVKIGSLQATSEQQYDVKRLVKLVVGGRQRLSLANAVYPSVYRECWDACRIGNLPSMSRTQYPQAIAFLRTELSRLAALGDSGLFGDEGQGKAEVKA